MASPFLDLPVELRLHIYTFALLDDPVITISTAEIVGPAHEIVDRLYGGKRKPFPGIPERHEPVVETGYHASLLSATKPAVVRTNTTCDESYEYGHTAHLALLLVSKQVNGEVVGHFKLPKNRSTSLFVSYPHGLHVCKTLTPHLLRQTRSVHIAGQYVSRTFCPARAACMGPREQHPSLSVKHHSNLIPDSASQLGSLISNLFGPTPTHRIQKLELRIYYPGDDSYSTVWGDDASPTVIALRNICAGEVGIEVWRGRDATGVYLTATPPKEGEERKRVVSTVWRKLEEGRRGEKKAGSWVVDERWPEWERGYAVSEGARPDVIVSEGA